MTTDTQLKQLGDRLQRAVATDLRTTAAAGGARRPTGRWRPVIAVTGLAAVGVVTALAVGSGSRPAVPHAIGAGDSALPASSPPAATQDVAEIVRHVRARLAVDASSVMESVSYVNGEVGAGGSVVNLGYRVGSDVSYTAPDGAEYDHLATYGADGSPTNIQDVMTGAVVNHTLLYSAIVIDPVTRTYSRSRTVSRHVDGPPARPSFSGASPTQLRQALRSGGVTELGTPTFRGARVIALLMTPDVRGLHGVRRENAAGLSADGKNILYVDPATYQPVGDAYVPDAASRDRGGLGQTSVGYWRAATPDAIATAKTQAIPAGYRRVTDVG